MAVITGTITYNTTVTVTAASGGDATAIAAMFNNVLIANVNAVTKATASSTGSVATILWTQATTRAGNEVVRNQVANLVAGNLTLTSPISMTVATVLVIS